MKQLSFLVVFLSVLTTARSQSPVDEVFDKYAGKEGYTTVIISKYMFDLFKNIDADDPEAKEMNELISNLTGIKILASEKKDEGGSFLKDVKKKISSADYKELMTIKEEDQDVQFLVRENGGKVIELLMVAGGNGDNVLISIQGNIDMKNISKLAKAMNIEGMDKLEDIDK